MRRSRVARALFFIVSVELNFTEEGCAQVPPDVCIVCIVDRGSAERRM